MKVEIDIAEKYADVIKKIKADIMQLEAGTWFVMRQYLEKYNVPEEDWVKVEREVYKLIRRQISTPLECRGEFIGQSFDIPRIRQKGLKKITLELSAFFRGTTVLIAQLEGEKVAFDELTDIATDMPSQIEMPQEEFLKKLNDLHIEKWNKEYFNSGILDGEQWELTIDYTYKRVKIYGSNDYPENFDELRKLLGYEEDEEL